MTRSELLRKKIKDAGLLREAIMRALNIKSYSTFRAKVNDPTTFTAKQIAVLVEILRLTPEDRDRIFFTENVA